MKVVGRSAQNYDISYTLLLLLIDWPQNVKFTVTQHSEDEGRSSQDVFFLFLTLLGNVHNDFAKEGSKVNIVKWKDEGCLLQKFVKYVISDSDL